MSMLETGSETKSITTLFDFHFVDGEEKERSVLRTSSYNVNKLLVGYTLRLV